MKYLAASLSLLIISFVLSSCTQQKEQPKEQPALMPQSPHQALEQGPVTSIAGVEWKVPAHWKELPARQMRIATYGVPAAGGDGEDGECAVFYFGTGQGGDVAGNISRWASQFEGSPKPEQSSKEVNGLKVTMVSIAGSYLAPAGPMMQSQGKKENYRLLGAIVEAPEGSVFFKFTGPAKTIHGSEGDFNALVGSLARQANS
jgi:hypothetical protein